MSAKHTPGPLTVRIDDEWPFTIRTIDGKGSTVFSRDMPAHSTKQRRASQVMSGAFMGEHAVDAVIANDRALSDEVLRAAAPELLEALNESIEREYNQFEPDNQSNRYKRLCALRAKATGGQQ